MAAFPRTILPRSATPLRGAGALQSIGNTGKIQRRSVMQKGRWWTETYPPFRPGDATGRAFLAFVDMYDSPLRVKMYGLPSSRGWALMASRAWRPRGTTFDLPVLLSSLNRM